MKILGITFVKNNEAGDAKPKAPPANEPATLEQSLVSLPPECLWSSVSSPDGGKTWYARIDANDGWAYCNFKTLDCYPSMLAAMNDAVAKAWARYGGGK